MNTLIISLKYNPGHFSHLIATYKMLEELSYDPCLYVNQEFNIMDTAGEYKRINEIRDIGKNKIDLAFFWFPSIKNIPTVLKLKFFHKSKVVFIFHEPFDSLKKYYNAGFGIWYIFKIWLINLINIFVLFFSKIVILPSKKSYNLYLSKYLHFNKNCNLIPLLFDDENGESENIGNDKEYISYIGTIAPDHAFERFVDFVFYCLNKNLLPNIKFAIATRSKMPNDLKRKLNGNLDKNRVIIRDGKDLLNEEINYFFKKSIIVWNAYYRTNQSGVLPKAYMFGCAVLVSKDNINDFVEIGNTGIEVDNDQPEEIFNASKYIIENKSYFFHNTRQKFMNTFYYKSKIGKYKTLLS